MSEITSHNYVEHVLRTDSPITPELIERISNPQTIRLLHAAMGLTTEAGELMDMLKRHIYYGKELDVVNAKEELGDSAWYCGLAIDVLKTTMNEIMTMNINKLRLRYPEKFTEECAIERNVEAERELLEKTRIVGITPGSELDTNFKQAYLGTEEQPVIVGIDYASGSDKTVYYPQLHESSKAVVYPAYRGSQQAEDFIKFAAEVVEHIEMYVVPQYGDKDTELAKDWSVKILLEQAKKYIDRFGRNSRPGQQWLDFLKMTHYVQKAATKFKEEGGCE